MATNPLDPIGSLSKDLNDQLPDDHINIIIVQWTSLLTHAFLIRFLLPPSIVYPSYPNIIFSRRSVPNIAVLPLSVRRAYLPRTSANESVPRINREWIGFGPTPAVFL